MKPQCRSCILFRFFKLIQFMSLERRQELHECPLLVLGIILSLKGLDFAPNNITLAADVWHDWLTLKQLFQINENCISPG